MAIEIHEEAEQEVLRVIFRDLQPLRDAYPDGTAIVPDDLESLVIAQDADDDPRVVGWLYSAPTAIFQRGKPAKEVMLEITGVTIVFGPPGAPDEELVLRRYVDWADVWAQLGRSSGRGELDPEPIILDPTDLPLAEGSERTSSD